MHDELEAVVLDGGLHGLLGGKGAAGEDGDEAGGDVVATDGGDAGDAAGRQGDDGGDNVLGDSDAGDVEFAFGHC